MSPNQPTRAGMRSYISGKKCDAVDYALISLQRLLVKTQTNRNVDNQNVDKPKRRQTETSTNQNVDKPKRRQSETSTNQNVQTETSTNQNVYRPKRRQTETSTNQNVDKPKRPHTETSTSQNVDTRKLLHNSQDTLHVIYY